MAMLARIGMGLRRGHKIQKCKGEDEFLKEEQVQKGERILQTILKNVYKMAFKIFA